MNFMIIMLLMYKYQVRGIGATTSHLSLYACVGLPSRVLNGSFVCPDTFGHDRTLEHLSNLSKSFSR